MFLSDQQILKRCLDEQMIEPFENHQISISPMEGRKLISYGISSYGYDVRLDREFLTPKFDTGASYIVDPKNTSELDYDLKLANEITIPPHSFILGKTIEYFKIPRDILALCIGKSTYARCGVIVNVTPLEPEWEGHVTIEISNTNVKPVKVYAGEGIAQFLFTWCDPEIEFDMDNGVRVKNLCQTSYADRNGKYNKQINVTPAKM
jgi:dCTP deaminase